MYIPDIKNIDQRRRTEKCMSKVYPEFCSHINDIFPHDISWSEKLYWYYHNINNYPRCPVCGNKVKYKDFNRGYYEYCSTKCVANSEKVREKSKKTNLEKYGTENPFASKKIQEKIKETNFKNLGVEYPGQSDIVKGKIKKTNLERYGCEYGLSNKNVKEKRKQTNLKRYGAENPFASKKIQEKIKETNFKNLGVEYPGQSEEVKEKIKQSNIERYGVEYPLQNQEILNKVEQTCIKKYGYKTPLQSEEVKEKIKQSNIDHFGVEYPLQSPSILEKIKQTCIKRYGEDNYSKTSEFKEYITTIIDQILVKRKQTCIDKYGVEFYSQSDKYIENIPNMLQKTYITKKQNKSFNTSSVEEEFSNWLLSNNIEFIRQCRSEKYPFSCDFYFPDKDLYLEIQGTWTHGHHPFDPTNQSDIDIVTEWKNKNTKFYNNAIDVWTVKDPLKRETAKKNNLNWVEVFSCDLNDVIEVFNSQSQTT